MGNVKLFFAVLAAAIICIKSEYQFGLGRADVTGPSVEIAFMGYGSMSQTGQGIHLRQFARAFIIQDDSGKRVVFVNVDISAISQAMRRDLSGRLRRQFGNIYTMDNVMLAPTHTHGGPGGYHQLMLYDITCLGFIRESYAPIIDGIFQSIMNAHNNMISGKVFYSEIPVKDFGVNRSPASYVANPESERKQYSEDIDRNMQQIRFVNGEGRIVGAFNWLAIHAVSMNNVNRLISSDNLGYASILLEQQYNPSDLIGRGDFIGAFSTSNSADISPNTKGASCNATRLECDTLTSTCPDGDVCMGRGPGSTDMENTKIIGTRIYQAALQALQQGAQRELTGSVGFIHQFVEMSRQTGTWFNRVTQQNEEIRGCLPALGTAFAAGTTDGPGAINFFEQGDTDGNWVWQLIGNALRPPTRDDRDCHAPKPILMMTGRMSWPYLWQPQIIPTQVFKIGDAVILGVPGEITTMAGRRLNAEIKALGKETGQDLVVLPTGMANTYASYFTTFEEYQIQRYEGGSTPFGPHSLSIIQRQFSMLYSSMVNNRTIPPGPTPPDQSNQQITVLTQVAYDTAALGASYGTCLVQPRATHFRGDELLVTFVAGNPRNNLMTDSSYFFVERRLPNNSWVTVATDANWETRFIWRRTSVLLGRSEIDFYWEIPQNVENGVYRIRHQGAQRGVLTGVRSYSGSTRNFEIVTPRSQGSEESK